MKSQSILPITPAALPKTIHGVVLDFDGVIFDSEKHWATIENPYLRRHIPYWEDSDYHQLIGKSLSEVYDFLVQTRQFSLAKQEYFDDYEVMAQGLYHALAQPLPDITHLLEAFRNRGLRCAIASSSKRSWIDLALKSHGLKDYFEFIVSAHDPEVAYGKPAPDVYLRAVELLNEPVDTLIAIEDSQNGVTAAKAAGLFCLGLRNGDNDSQDLSAVDREFVSYKDLASCLR